MIIMGARSDGLQLPICHSCLALEVSRSGYYRWLRQSEMVPSVNSEYLNLKNQIQEIALEFPFYGYRRITAELQNRGYVVNHKRVLNLMRQDSLLCQKKKFKPVTTDSSHGLPVYPNLLKGRAITGLNQVWASDITYVRLQHEHIYLAVILDLYSRKCIGWELSRSMGSQLAMNALAMALDNRTTECADGLVHHSDQGVQYASKDYVDCLKKHNILISMSRKGNPYDNAFAESFIKTIKVEEVYINEYKTFEDAFRNIWHFIENVYNKKRLHSALDYRSPVQFEMEVALNTIA
jgi:putative transposase